MSAELQSYQNHAKTPYPIIIVAVLAIITIALVIGGHLLTMPLLGEAGVLVLALAVGLLAYKDRMGDLCLQDRIIRLEMQLRLERLGLGDRAGKLALNQLVALRFASDAELPALADAVLSEGLVKGSDIKKRVKSWVADHQRV